MNWRPQSLFGRTALLIAGALLLFSIIAWQAIVWTAMVPAADLAVHSMVERAQAAVEARRTGGAMPEGARFESGEPPANPRLLRGLAFSTYIDTVRGRLQKTLQAPDVRLTRMAAPSEIWVRLREVPDAWLVLTWRLAGPKAPIATVGVLALSTLIVLAGAAFSARRLTAPLAGLAAAAARVAEGERVQIPTDAGPSEVRSLAVAFQSMSHRLAELDDQRELMLGGISHDLRTPLARVRVAIELLQPQDPALIAEMIHSVDEMDHMIGQFLQYTRANYRESPVSASLNEVVRNTLLSYAADESLRLQLDAAAARRFAVECVRHCLLNLVQNAFEYGVAPVVVAATLTPEGLELRVRDAGVGLSEAQWIEAIRPFHRLPSPSSGRHSGLGLALVDRLVTVSGGTLAARRLEQGFEVTVRLPTSAT